LDSLAPNAVAQSKPVHMPVAKDVKLVSRVKIDSSCRIVFSDRYFELVVHSAPHQIEDTKVRVVWAAFLSKNGDIAHSRRCT